MKRTLDEIEREFLQITSEQKSSIKGGGGIQLSDADLEFMFNYSASATVSGLGAVGGLGGFNSVNGQAFSTKIRAIAATDAGGSFLAQLLAKEIADKQQNPSSDDRIEVLNAGTTQFQGGSNNLFLGDLISANLSQGNNNADYFTRLTHELYHAYQSIVENNPTNDNGGEVTGELDADIVEGLVAKQYDSVAGTNYYGTMVGQFITNTAANATTQNGLANFVTSWKDVMAGNFTLADYNNLIKYFKASDFNYVGIANANDPTKDQAYNKMKTDDPFADTTALKLSDIYKFAKDTATMPTATQLTVPQAQSSSKPTPPPQPGNNNNNNSPDPGADAYAINQYIQAVITYFGQTGDGGAGPGGNYNWDPSTGQFVDSSTGSVINGADLPDAVMTTIIDSSGGLTLTLTQADIDSISAALDSYTAPVQGYIEINGVTTPIPDGPSASAGAGDSYDSNYSSSNDSYSGSYDTSSSYGNSYSGSSYGNSYSGTSYGSYSGGGSYGSSYGSSYDTYC